MVLQVSSRTLLEGTLGCPQTQTYCSQQDVTPWDTWHLFSNSTKASIIAPFPSCTASLISSALLCPITSWLDLASPFWSEQSFPSVWCCGVVPALTLLVQYSRGRRTGNRTTGPTAVETSLAFALCCELHNTVILRSRCRLTTQLICWQ